MNVLLKHFQSLRSDVGVPIFLPFGVVPSKLGPPHVLLFSRETRSGSSRKTAGERPEEWSGGGVVSRGHLTCQQDSQEGLYLQGLSRRRCVMKLVLTPQPRFLRIVTHHDDKP